LFLSLKPLNPDHDGEEIGYCDIDSSSTTCEENTRVCDRPDPYNYTSEKYLKNEIRKRIIAFPPKLVFCSFFCL